MKNIVCLLIIVTGLTSCMAVGMRTAPPHISMNPFVIGASYTSFMTMPRYGMGTPYHHPMGF